MRSPSLALSLLFFAGCRNSPKLDTRSSPLDATEGDAIIQPDASETCDGANNGCAGSTDESDAIDATYWYVDSDGDGYETASSRTPARPQHSGYVNASTACDGAYDL